MPEITEAQLKARLSAIEDTRYANLRRAGLPERTQLRTTQREILEKRFHHGIDGRRKALEQLATVSRPYTPTFIVLETPFLIWANRLQKDADKIITEGTDILIDSHIEPLNNWAKILLNYATKDAFFATDCLNFYFMWRNETGSDAVANISSSLTLNGSCSVHADSDFAAGVWGVDPFSDVSVAAGLSVFEWWNNPPTEPLSEANQTQDVTTLSATGGAWSGDGRSTVFSGNYQVAYNIFRIPSNQLAVFEVGLSVEWKVWQGKVNVDFLLKTI